MSTVLFYFLLKIKIHFYSFRIKHRILITNNQKGENMDNLFQYVLHYVLLTIMIVGALLLFPFFPKFVLFLAFYYARDRYYHFDKRRYDTRKQSSACKAVTLFLFSIMLCCYTYLCLGK